MSKDPKVEQLICENILKVGCFLLSIIIIGPIFSLIIGLILKYFGVIDNLNGFI